VARVVTVAANLDHAAWTALHEVSPLWGSLNPADYAASLRQLPQLHLAGAEDRVVPSDVAAAYVERLTPGHRVKLVVIPDFDHECCWVEAWDRLAARFGFADAVPPVD
jgi:pimeloyl-ACP methyl ester carboxylesterase